MSIDTNENNGQRVTQAMIFSAGLGTRFKPWTDEHPKALALVNGKTLLQRNIEYLQQNGISDIIVNVHHFSEQIIDALDRNKGWGSHVVISDESHQLLETGGGLLRAKDLFRKNSPFITCNVDILTNLRIKNLIDFHQKHGALVSFGVSSRTTSRYLLFNNEDRLCGWRNVQTGEEKISLPGSSLIQKAYSCVAVFNYRIFDLIPFRGKFSLIDVYLALAAEHLIMGYDHTGNKLVDVGKPESIKKAESIFT
jgi:N-acetyl-alpha-D-muramate 1-phosphate uridylyltransferase